MAVNWVKIKNEYITTNISQRKLAEKYGVSFDTLKGIANREKWKALKDETHNRLTTETQQKTVEKIAEKQAQETVDGIALMENTLATLSKLNEVIGRYVIELDKPEKTLIKNTDAGRAIIKEKSGIDKAVKIANIAGIIIKNTETAINTKKAYSESEDIEDSGLIAALMADIGELCDDTDSIIDDEEEGATID